MTALNKQALRERYSPQPVPKCHICGAEMTVQRISASRITYGCTGATYDDAGGITQKVAASLTTTTNSHASSPSMLATLMWWR